jgi:hypothetical protein
MKLFPHSSQFVNSLFTRSHRSSSSYCCCQSAYLTIKLRKLLYTATFYRLSITKQDNFISHPILREFRCLLYHDYINYSCRYYFMPSNPQIMKIRMNTFEDDIYAHTLCILIPFLFIQHICNLGEFVANENRESKEINKVVKVLSLSL